MSPALKGAAAMAALILLASCETLTPEGPAGPPVATGIHWRCTGGRGFTVRINANGARVHADGRDYALPHVSGAGARYAAGGVEYWERAGIASLMGASGGPYENCRH